MGEMSHETGPSIRVVFRQQSGALIRVDGVLARIALSPCLAVACISSRPLSFVLPLFPQGSFSFVSRSGGFQGRARGIQGPGGGQDPENLLKPIGILGRCIASKSSTCSALASLISFQQLPGICIAAI